MSTPRTTTKNPRPQTWIGLAAATGFSRESFQRWRTLPGAPSKPDEPAWRRFLAERGLGGGRRISSERERLLVARLEEQVKLARARRMRETGSTIDAGTVNQLLFHLATTTRTTLYSTLVNELPGKLVGRTPAEVRDALRDTADRIVLQLRTAAGEFAASHPTQPGMDQIR